MTTLKSPLESYDERKTASQKKRAMNREASKRFLEHQDIEFEVKSGGSHLLVTGSKGLIDFWPGTGKWISRDGTKGRGVRELSDGIAKGSL